VTGTTVRPLPQFSKMMVFGGFGGTRGPCVGGKAAYRTVERTHEKVVLSRPRDVIALFLMVSLARLRASSLLYRAWQADRPWGSNSAL
jgi:hypothetical protein